MRPLPIRTSFILFSFSLVLATKQSNYYCKHHGHIVLVAERRPTDVRDVSYGTRLVHRVAESTFIIQSMRNTIANRERHVVVVSSTTIS